MWKTVKLGEIASWVRGLTYSKKDEVDEGGIAVLRATNIDLATHKIVLDEIRLVSDAVKVKDDKYAQVGDLLVCTASGSKSHVGKVAIVEDDLGMALGGFMAAIRCNEDCYPRFLYYILTSQKFKWHLNNLGDGANINNLKFSQIEEYELPLPPLAEQQRIVAKLDAAFAEIDRAVNAKRKKFANLQRISNKKVTSLVNELLLTYSKKPLSKVCVKITKGSSPKWQGVNYVDKPGILFITSENVGSNRLRMEKIKYVEEKFNKKDSKSILQRGDVLTNIVGASIGRTAVFDLENSVAANINQAVCLIRTDTALLKPRFLSTLMNSEVLLNALHDGETSMARANISLGFVSSLEIPLPSLAEQASFVEKCDTIFAGILALSELTEQQIDLSVTLKSAILAQELQPPQSEAA